MAKAKPCPPAKAGKGKMDESDKPAAKGGKKPLPPWLKKGGK